MLDSWLCICVDCFEADLRGYWFRWSRTGFYRPETACHEKIVLKIKSIVMQTTNNLIRKLHNYIHFMGWFTQFERKCSILEIFHYFQHFERCRSFKKWQLSEPKIVDWYLDFTKESYTTLKSVISSFKICFQNYGQLKRKFLRPKNTSITFLNFELSSLSRPMLKTWKNTIRNQFEQQWFDVISFQKPRRVYPAIWYNLKPFAHRKGRFTLSTPAKSTSHVSLSKGNRTNFKNHNVFASRNWILTNRTMHISVCFIP